MAAIGALAGEHSPHSVDPRRPVRVWLWCVAALVVLMIVVGGATRLTESGLSITEWRPVTGILPPLSEAAWQAEFEKYRQIPQYQLINKGMSLDAFRNIFWWEWAHRLLGRLIGFVFLLPFLFFLWRGLVDRPLAWKLGGLFVLGGLQGAVGWWMVASGLVHRTDVSQYRLAVHLTLACVILAATVAVAENLRPRSPAERSQAPASRRATVFGWVLLVAVLFQIFLGGLVAGLDAGLTYTTWPLMDGHLIPPAADLFVQQPAWRNLFENVLTVQFDHRMVAYGLWTLALIHVIDAWKGSGGPVDGRPRTGGPGGSGNGGVLRRAGLIFLLISAQAAIGIATLVHQVPIDLALAHQFGAAVVLIVTTLHLMRLTAHDDPGVRTA